MRLGDARPGADAATICAGWRARRPLEATALALALLSLAGLPAAGGFIAKFYLFKSLVRRSSWILLGIAAVGAALGFYYYARFFTAPFLGQATTSRRRDRCSIGCC